MKKFQFFLLSIILLPSIFVKAQFATHKMLHIGYVYQNQSFAELGGRLLFIKQDDVAYRIGAAALLGETHGKFAIMPKLQGDILFNFERNVDFLHSYYFLAGVEATNQYVAPKIGISLFGILDLTGGYAFSIHQKGLYGKTLNGPNINFTINLPTVMIHDLFN